MAEGAGRQLERLEWLAKSGWPVLATSGGGPAQDNDILLVEEQAPPKLGVFSLEGEVVTFQAEPEVTVFSDSVPVTQLRLVRDEAGEPSRMTHGTLGWLIIRRMER